MADWKKMNRELGPKAWYYSSVMWCLVGFCLMAGGLSGYIYSIFFIEDYGPNIGSPVILTVGLIILIPNLLLYKHLKKKVK